MARKTQKWTAQMILLINVHVGYPNKPEKVTTVMLRQLCAGTNAWKSTQIMVNGLGRECVLIAAEELEVDTIRC